MKFHLLSVYGPGKENEKEDEEGEKGVGERQQQQQQRMQIQEEAPWQRRRGEKEKETQKTQIAQTQLRRRLQATPKGFHLYCFVIKYKAYRKLRRSVPLHSFKIIHKKKKMM